MEEAGKAGVVDDLAKDAKYGPYAVTTTVTDAAIARAQRWATIQDLQRRIAGLEGDAQDQDDLANQLEHTGKGWSC